MWDNNGVGDPLLYSKLIAERMTEGMDLPARLTTNPERLAGRGAFTARTGPSLPATFELIDDAEVCIEVPNPLDPGEPFAVIDLQDAEFAASVRETFDPKWETAEPLPAARLAGE